MPPSRAGAAGSFQPSLPPSPAPSAGGSAVAAVKRAAQPQPQPRVAKRGGKANKGKAMLDVDIVIKEFELPVDEPLRAYALPVEVAGRERADKRRGRGAEHAAKGGKREAASSGAPPGVEAAEASSAAEAQQPAAAAELEGDELEPALADVAAAAVAAAASPAPEHTEAQREEPPAAASPSARSRPSARAAALPSPSPSPALCVRVKLHSLGAAARSLCAPLCASLAAAAARVPLPSQSGLVLCAALLLGLLRHTGMGQKLSGVRCRADFFRPLIFVMTTMGLVLYCDCRVGPPGTHRLADLLAGCWLRHRTPSPRSLSPPFPSFPRRCLP
ncbi:hypothetical protein T492DRAFT_421652 [Pavlovales sp. CCMP2436]|nr:hypothetical protein T492DRAFT_421652 [Pavlovales sp. CCMP2436]